MTAIPIPTSARAPIEYIPTVQDADRYVRTKEEQISGAEIALARREQALRIRQREGRADAEPDNSSDEMRAEAASIAAERARIDGERELTIKTVVTMRETYPEPQTFLLSIPTATDRERISSQLISLGLQEVRQETVRATLIDELFSHDWGKGSDEANAAEAEDIANFLDSVWMRSEAHDVAVQRWQEQEVERVLDEMQGAPTTARAEMPPKVIGVRENARAQLYIDEMMATSQRLMNLAANQADYQRRQAIAMARIHIVGVEGFTSPVPLIRDARTGVLPEAAVLALREQVDGASWNDVTGRIMRMYQLDGSEEKNSVSPPVSQSPPNGSPEPSDATSDNGGPWTASSTDPHPDDEFERTIEKSSGSSTATEPDRRLSGEMSTPTVGV